VSQFAKNDKMKGTYWLSVTNLVDKITI
jgi:hypothetical protein